MDVLEKVTGHMPKQRGGPDPIPWRETAAPEGQPNTRFLLPIAFLFVCFPLSMLAGSAKGAGWRALDFRPEIGTAHSEGDVQRRAFGQEQSLPRRTVACHFLSGIMFAQLYIRWDERTSKFVWLGGFCALLLLLLAYLLQLRARKKTAEQIAAHGREFDEIFASMAADLIASPDCLRTGEVKGWLGSFLHRFGLDSVGLFELLENGDRAVPLYTPTMASVSPVLFAEREEGEIGDTLPNLTVLASDPGEIMARFHGLKRRLCGNDFHFFMVLPLRVEGELLGALVLAVVQPKPKWPNENRDELQSIANIFAGALKRKRTEDVLRANQELRESILASLVGHLAVIDRSGKILVVNRTWLRFSGENGAGAYPSVRPGANYIAECERAAGEGDIYARQALSGIKDVLEGQREYFEMAYPCHSPVKQRWFSMAVTRLTQTEGGAVIQHNDITERKLAESRLRESETRFRLMADTAPVMMWMSGLDRLCTYFNQGWLDFTGRTLYQELGNGWTEGIHPDDLSRCMQTYIKAFDGRQKFSMEYRLRRADGQYRWIVDSGVPRFMNDGTFAGYVGCCFDITDRKDLAAARMEFSGRLIKAQEEERARIARELHDDIGQRLALLAIDVQQLDGALPGTNQEVHARMQALWRQINDISTDAGRISHQLHSPKLQILGLALAIRGLCDDFSKQYPIAIDFSCTGVPPQLESTASLSLFRVAQEALHNVSRHSHAKNVKVKLRGNTSEVRLSIYDDGKGFDVDRALAGQGLGLISMTERLRLVGGAFSIQSGPSFGTRIVARVPLGAQSFSESAPSEQPRNTAA